MEGAKERWWPLFLLDAIVFHAERAAPGRASHNLQLEYKQYQDSGFDGDDSQVDGYAFIPKRRSFNQHLVRA